VKSTPWSKEEDEERGEEELRSKRADMNLV
jgi:hypothetical protein